MSQTQENLLKAFAGESMARNKYTFFAKQAEKEGQIWISKVFLETADNERAHAEEEFEQIRKIAESSTTLAANELGSTLENLREAVKGETHEYQEMYPDFARIAREEGETAAEKLFTEIKEVEEKHAERYQILADRLESGKLYETEDEIEWKCLNCGYIHKGKSAPKSCPVCKKPQGWYEGLNIIR